MPGRYDAFLSNKDMFSVALVGAGRVGSIRAGVIGKSDEAKLRVVADVDVTRAQYVARNLGAEAVPDWRAAVARPDVNMVIVATPTKFHQEIAVAALEAGKHVLCEKPLGRTTDEAERIVEAAKRAQLVLKTGFNYRHMAHIRKAKELIRAGMLGPLHFLRCRYGHGGRPGYETAWCTDAELSGGGVLLEQGIHVVDLVRFLLGEPSTILAQTSRYFWKFPTVEDNCFCLMKTTAGQTALIHVSWTQWVNVFHLEIFGRDGYVELEGRDGHYGPQRLTWGQRKPDHSRPEQEHFEFAKTEDSWDLEWQEFLDAVRTGRQPLGSGLDGLRAQQVVNAAYRSARHHAWVEVDRAAVQTATG
jgi:predicted dehydrogenase